jgi:hypothetical protein
MWWYTPVHFYQQPPQFYRKKVSMCGLRQVQYRFFYNIEIFWETKCLMCNDRSNEVVRFFFDKLITSLGIRNLMESGCWFMVWFILLKATFNNISVISWQSILLVEETRVPRENHWPASHWQTSSTNVGSITPPHERCSNSQP